MIHLLVEDNPNDRHWKLKCDKCGYAITYGSSKEIEDWKFKKNFLSHTEKHYCPSCK